MDNKEKYFEWLETDGQGGFSMGSSTRTPNRRYHSYLIHSENPPIERHVYLKHLEIILSTEARVYNLSNFFFCDPTIDRQEDYANKTNFSSFPWPTWKVNLASDLALRFELFMTRASKTLVLRWELLGEIQNSDRLTLKVRPFLSGLSMHSLQKVSSEAMWYESSLLSDRLSFVDAANAKEIFFLHNANDYDSLALWYHNFYYSEERRRGYDFQEDLYSPGFLEFDLSNRSALMAIRAKEAFSAEDTISSIYDVSKSNELKRRSSREKKATSDFLVQTKTGPSIIAGYPWFADWGRDTFISIRGLLLSQGLYKEAEDLILRWKAVISEGMIPNRFPDEGAPEYNSVDASLWYVIAIYELLAAAKAGKYQQIETTEKELLSAVEDIISHYEKGTHYNIKMTQDGLLYSGEQSYALTWMDARYAEQAITPRAGLAVEIQALWINCLEISSLLLGTRAEILEKAKSKFIESFWSSENNCLYDVLGSSEEEAKKIRPNQIFAIAGLPFQVLPKALAQNVLAVVKEHLLTDFGLRTLSNRDLDFRGRYMGPLAERDKAYHQGTAWPWLIGAYCEASLLLANNSDAAKEEVKKCLEILQKRFDETLQCDEIFDGLEPQESGGCPFQAWTLGELLRLKSLL